MNNAVNEFYEVFLSNPNCCLLLYVHICSVVVGPKLRHGKNPAGNMIKSLLETFVLWNLFPW